MSETSGAFLVLGLFLTGTLVWGLATGKMLSQYFVDDRQEHPLWFWTNAAVNAVLALVFLYMAWVDW
jgi:hypothetical protein